MKTTSPGPLAAFVGALAFGCSDGSPVPDTTPYLREALLSPETCRECHGDYYAEWSASMHAYASIDPVFRAMNARGQKETDGKLGDFCVNCHAPMALQEGATHDGTNLDSVPPELQGVTCYFCHNVTEVTGTHDNALVLANDVTMRGGIHKPTKYKGHLAEYSPLFDETRLESASLCGSCHDIVVPAHFSGASEDVPLERTFSEWRGSIFADQKAQNHRSCTTGCHMPTERGVVATPKERPPMPLRTRHRHEFPGVDTAVVKGFPQADQQRRVITDLLSLELRVVVCVDSITHNPMTITLENLSAGHNFPSGASQDRRLWVEIHGFAKAKGADSTSAETEVFSSGAVPEGTAATELDGTWILRDETLKMDGTPAHTFWDAAVINANTIPVGTPGDVVTVDKNRVERRFAVDKALPSPTHVTVTVWLEPIGLDVIDDMVASHFLDESIRAEMPRFALTLADPSEHAGPHPVTLDWTAAATSPQNPEAYDGLLMYQRCLETTPIPTFTPPPASP